MIHVRIRTSASVTLNINHFFAAKTLVIAFLNLTVLSYLRCPESFGPVSTPFPEAVGRRKLVVFSTWPFAFSNSRILGFMSLQPSLVPSTLTPTLSHFFLLGLRHARQYQIGYGLSPSFSVSTLYQAMCSLPF